MKKKKKLIELFKNRKFKKIQLFVLAKRYYELIFILKKYYGFNEIKYILPDYENEEIISKKIIEQFIDNKMNNFLINKILNFETIGNNQNTKDIRDFETNMNIIFSFWRKIFNEIEISIDGEKQILYYISRPVTLYLFNDQKMYYEDNVDRSSRDSKLISMYENLDSFIFEMVYNSHNHKFNLANIFYYYGLELINIILFIIDNIILLIHYYKSWEEDYSEYNKIENDKTSKILLILSGVHILYLIAVIINWFVNRLKIEYFYSLAKYSNMKDKSKFRFDINNKSFLFRDLDRNFSSNFSRIYQFFTELTTPNKISILIIDTIILNPKVLPFLFSLICLIFYYFLSQIFLVIPLILIANLVPTLSAIFKGLFNKFKYLLFIYSYTLIVLYIFSWIAFLFLPYLFKFEVVDKYNENIVDENDEAIEEYVCSSSVQCILYFLNFGLSSGGNLELNLISFKNNYGFYLRQFFFDIFFFLCINMIFSNVFLALITDAFGEMREKAWHNENDRNNVCFICDLTRSDCINQNIEFSKHIKEHSKWKYINFMYNIITKKGVELDTEEYYVWNLMKNRSIDWIPIKKNTE